MELREWCEDKNVTVWLRTPSHTTGITLSVAERQRHYRVSLNHTLKGAVLLLKMSVSHMFVASDVTCPRLCYKKSLLLKTPLEATAPVSPESLCEV